MQKLLRLVLGILIAAVLGFFLYLYIRMFASLGNPQGW